MRGLDPRIPLRRAQCPPKRDGRDKPGHDRNHDKDPWTDPIAMRMTTGGGRKLAARCIWGSFTSPHAAGHSASRTNQKGHRMSIATRQPTLATEPLSGAVL